MDYTVHGILQTKILELVAVPFSKGSFQPRNEFRFLALQVDSLPDEPLEKPENTGLGSLSLLQRIFRPRNRIRVSCIAGGFFTNRATSEGITSIKKKKKKKENKHLWERYHYSYMQDHRVWTQQDEGRVQMLGRIGERGDIWCFSFVWIKWNEYFWCFLKAWSVLLNLEEVSWNSFRNPVWPIFFSHASGKPYQQGNGFRGKWFWDLLAGPMCKLSDSMQMENSNTCSNCNMKCSIPPLE